MKMTGHLSPIAPSMPDAPPTFQARLADSLASAGSVIARRWLDRVVALNAVDPNRVFPTRELLDHVPELIEGIAASLRPVTEGGVEVASNPAILAKARELGKLRHTLGFALQGVLKEYEVLGAILLHFLGEESRKLSPGEDGVVVSFDMSRRLHLALSNVLQATVDTYVQEYLDGITRFERAFSEQLSRPLAAAHGASELLAETDSLLPSAEREKLQRIIRNSLEGVERSMRELVEYSTTRFRRTIDQQRLRVSDVVGDVRKQLRETAAAHGVELYFVTPMPELDIDAAGLESVLEVLLTNAIQYADPLKERRHASVGCVLTEENGWVLYVRDNGLGMTAEQQAALFENSVDLAPSDVASSSLPSIGHDEQGPKHRGIGIHLARQIVDRWSGRLWVESAPRKGSIFFFTLPAGH